MSTTTTSGEEPPAKRTRRREADVNSVPLLSSLGLKEALVQSGHPADVIFVVGGGHEGQGYGDGQIGRREIAAHKLILSARSEVFGAMMEERWNGAAKSGDNSNVVRIEIDPTINPTAFEQIIKFIYKDDVSICLKSLKFEDLFEFRSLAEMYGFIQLKEAASVKIAHDLVKDYKKCFLTLEQETVDQDLRAVAFSVIKWNLAEALAADDMPSRWTEQIWENVLSDEGFSLEEVLLFKGLWRWKEHAPASREAVFQKLLELIRFPIMRSSELLAVVRPTGCLSCFDLLNILQYQIDDITPNSYKPDIRFNTENREEIVRWVTSFKELPQTVNGISDLVLEDVAVEIFLLPGDYSGIVEVNRDFTRLTGFGPYTILQGRESGIKIFSDHTALSNLTLQGTMTIFHVTGCWTLIQNIVGTSKNTMFALAAKGEKNHFENFFFSWDDTTAVKLKDYELDCESKRTEFKSFCERQGIDFSYLDDTAHLRFVWSDGPRNTFDDFQYTHLKNRNVRIAYEYQTRFIVTEKDNVIQNVQFDEVFAFLDKSSLSQQPTSIKPPTWARLLAYSTSTGLRVSNCCFANICFCGDRSSQHHFLRVVVPKTILVTGSDHKFEDCRYGKMLDDGKNTVVSDCVAVPEWLDTTLPLPPTV